MGKHFQFHSFLCFGEKFIEFCKSCFPLNCTGNLCLSSSLSRLSAIAFVSERIEARSSRMDQSMKCAHYEIEICAAKTILESISQSMSATASERKRDRERARGKGGEFKPLGAIPGNALKLEIVGHSAAQNVKGSNCVRNVKSDSQYDRRLVPAAATTTQKPWKFDRMQINPVRALTRGLPTYLPVCLPVCLSVCLSLLLSLCLCAAHATVLSFGMR